MLIEAGSQGPFGRILTRRLVLAWRWGSLVVGFARQ